MTTILDRPHTRSAFLSMRRKTFESRNPATGELLAEVAEGDAEDIDRAVAAARGAFNGPWSTWQPFERQQPLLRIAEAVDQNFDDLSSLDPLDMGAPMSRTGGGRRRVRGMLRWYAGQATALHGDKYRHGAAPPPDSRFGNPQADARQRSPIIGPRTLDQLQEYLGAASTACP